MVDEGFSADMELFQFWCLLWRTVLRSSTRAATIYYNILVTDLRSIRKLGLSLISVFANPYDSLFCAYADWMYFFASVWTSEVLENYMNLLMRR